MADALKLRLDLFKYLHADAAPTFTNFTIDGTTDECGIAFMVEKAMTITQVGIRINTITGTPGELTISLNELTNTDGYPSATILGGGSPASVAIASPSASFTAGQVYWATLANSYAATAGQMMALKVDPTAGTWDASNSIAVTVALAGFGTRQGIPYAVQAPSGTYARVSGYPVYGVRSTTDTQGLPIEALNSTTCDSATNPNQAGFAFTLPSGWSDTYKLRGLIMLLSKPAAANQSFEIVLYSSDGVTELQTVTHDSEYFGTTSVNATYRTCEFFFDESTLSTLTFGTKYYIFIRPNASTGDIIINDFGVRQATDLQALPLGENCFFATKVDTATAPVETTTRRPYVGLILDDITEPTAGGGGLAANPARGFIA
jgi:hypothetical protein